MVGFNRRFSPHIRKVKQLLAGRSEPLAMHFTCNAGYIPPDVWVHDPEAGGGRIIGEACHFLDLLAYVADSRIATVASAQMGQGVAIREDKMSIVLSFEDGSVGTLNYFGNGHKAYPKERMEIYSEGRILRLDNFRKLEGWGFAKFRSMKTKLDKGHQLEFCEFVDQIAAGGEALIPSNQLVNATLASFAAVVSAAEKRTICLDEEYAVLLV
jgi:predicted dehydrogenase